MRKKILAFVFAGALLVGTAIPALAFEVPAPDSAPTSDASSGLDTAGDASDASDDAAQSVGGAQNPVPAPDAVP